MLVRVTWLNNPDFRQQEIRENLEKRTDPPPFYVLSKNKRIFKILQECTRM